MDGKLFWTAFTLIALAELGDKTQLAALTLTARSGKPVTVFFGTIAALAVITVLGVIVGQALAAVMPERFIKPVAACAFILVGILMLIGKI